MTLKQLIGALPAQERAALATEAQETLTAILERIAALEQLREYQAGYSIVLAGTIAEVEREERAEAGVVDLTGLRREMARS
jgi:hypothetical protein